MRGGRQRPAAVALMRGVLGLSVLLTLLAGCTGTSEEGDPVLLVVADGAGLELVEDSFGLGDRGDERTLRWLGTAHTFPDAGAQGVRDLAAARAVGAAGSAVRVFALYRTTDGQDLVRPFDASDVAPDDPSTLEPVGDAIDLSEIVQASGTFSEPLCTRAADVSPDGEWFALLHDPEACDVEGFPRIVVVDVPAREVVFTTSESAPVAAVPPIVASDAEGVWYLDPGETSARARFEPLPDANASAREVTLTNLSDPVGLAAGGLGVNVASNATVATFAPAGDAGATVAASEEGLLRVVDTSSMPTPMLLALSASDAVVHPDLSSDADVSVSERLAVPSWAAAMVDPNLFAFVIAPGAVSVLDLLGVTADSGRIPEQRFTVQELDEPHAATWIFGRRTEPSPAARAPGRP